MKVLLLGGGGREHAMAEAARRWGAELYTLMGNANPGIERLSAKVKRADPTDADAVVAFAKAEAIDMMIVGPEAALKAGVSDEVAEIGVRVAAPSQMAARIETSKSYMRDLLQRRSVAATVEASAFTDASHARAFIEASAYPVVVKPSGLTGGKGVQVEGRDFKEGDKAAAARYADEVLSKSVGGEARVVVERRLDGEEFTLMAFTDGTTVKPMPLVQDHKRAYDGDRGPNTGGMGSYSVADHGLPFLAPEDVAAARRAVVETVDALRADGCPFVGPIYGQFMATVDGPRVIEFNARFGDPEAMNVLPLLETDYLRICQAMADATLSELDVKFSRKATVCKYVVPKGYGTAQVAKGATLRVDEPAVTRAGARLYYAAIDDIGGGALRTTSSRALAVVGIADKLQMAERAAEEALKAVTGEYEVRHDIGTADLVTRKIERMKGLRIKRAKAGRA